SPSPPASSVLPYTTLFRSWVKATEALERLDVPVFTAMRLGSTEGEWRLSSEGVAVDEVHYRVGMPEFQGASQPLVVAAAQAPTLDRKSTRLNSSHVKISYA